MRKRAWILGCLLLAFLSMHAQSAWRILPEKAEVDHKKLRNTFVSSLYNDELQIEQVKVVNNRALLLQLRCPSHSLEYRSKVSIERIGKSILYKDFLTIKEEEPQFFLPDESVQIALDLSSFNLNGQYYFTFQLHTELNETYYVDVLLNTEEFEKPKYIEEIDYFHDYEKLQKNENHIYAWIEDNTEFPGGNEGLVRFIKENIRMGEVPSELYDFSRVSIGMIIDKDGSILYPEILDSDWREFDAEAMRLVQMMPKWKPGSIDGVKVKNRVMVEINYKDLDRSHILFNPSVWE